MAPRKTARKASTAHEATKERYTAELPALNALRREAEYALSESISSMNIKIDSIEGRVKELKSLLQKSSEKQLDDPISELSDIVGIRVICLFRSDMKKIQNAIYKAFEVLSYDDKVNVSVDSFGYMSDHYICKMKPEYVGPRYDQIKNIKFEVQSRTLGMHAWAAISHYLSYKGDWDTPVHLKKSLNALSGLFYIADNEFEAAYMDRQASLQDMEEKISSSYNHPINLDSVTAYLEKKFSDREHSPLSVVSKLVKELTESEYETIDQVDADVDRAFKAFLQHEKDSPPHNKKGLQFTDVGAVRGALRISSKKFRAVRNDTDDYAAYEKIMRES